MRGDVWISSFTADPAAIADYGPLVDADGARPLKVRVLAQAPAKGKVAAHVEGIANRAAAEALAGRALFVRRDALPLPAEDEFYYADLIGLRARSATGETLGRVAAVDNYGAGDVIEIKPEGGPSFLLPFSRRVVPGIDVAAGEIVVELPAGWLDAAIPDGDVRSGEP